MTNLEKIVHVLYKKYAIPKRKSKKFESLMIHKDFSTNDFIDVIKVLDSLDRERVINTEGFPQEIYRMFLNESTYLINFQALLSINLERDEWDSLYEAIKSCRDGRDFYSWYDKQKFVLFAKSSACPLDILKRYEQAIKNIKSLKIEDPSDAKHYYSYIKEAKKNIKSNINIRQADSSTKTLKGIISDMKTAQLRSQEKLARREQVKAHAIEIFSQTGANEIVDPEKDFRQAVKLRIQSLYFGEDRHIWTNRAWGKYIGLPQFSSLPVKARLEITDPYSKDHYELAALLAEKTNLPENQLAALALLEDFERSALGLITSEVFESLAANPSTPIASLINNIERFTALLDPTYDSGTMSLQERLRFFSTHSNPSIRVRTAQLPNLENELIESLSSDELTDVREAVARNTTCPIEILRLLSQDKNGWPQYGVGRNPATPLDILESLSEQSNMGREAVVSNPNASQEILCRLANAAEDYIRSSVAENPNCPVAVLEALAKDNYWAVRGAVARNPSCPMEVLEVLAKDSSDDEESEKIRKWALSNENCGISLKQNFEHKGHNITSSVTQLVSGATSHLAYKTAEKMLLTIVDDPNAPPNDLEIIATKLAFGGIYDSRIRVLKGLVANKNVEVKLLEVLVDRVLAIEDERIRSVTMEGKDIKGLPGVLSRRLKRASDEEKRAFESDDFLFFCGKDANKTALSRHPVGVILALCSNSPIDLRRLKTLSKSDDWLVRAAVARNSQTPQDVRLKLAGDDHPLVQKLAN